MQTGSIGPKRTIPLLINCTLDSNVINFDPGGLGGGIIGGAIRNGGRLTLMGCTISNNSADASGVSGNRSEGLGGGIFNAGILTLDASTITGNSVTGGSGSNATGSVNAGAGGDGLGGGVANVGGTLTIHNHDSDAHNIVSDPADPTGAAFELFGTDDEPTALGAARSITFSAPGLYHLYCSMHTKVAGHAGAWQVVTPSDAQASGYADHNPMDAWVLVVPIGVGAS